MRIERIALGPGNKPVDVIGTRCFITNLRKGRFTPTVWLKLLSDRWAVENQNHGVWDVAFQEDEHPWIDEPNGRIAVGLLRRIAYNILAVYRSATQRSPKSRRIPWRRLFTLARDALITATDEFLASFRPRTPSTQ